LASTEENKSNTTKANIHLKHKILQHKINQKVRLGHTTSCLDTEQFLFYSSLGSHGVYNTSNNFFK